MGGNKAKFGLFYSINIGVYSICCKSKNLSEKIKYKINGDNPPYEKKTCPIIDNPPVSARNF